ncbi:low-density lipoprotein receptor-related protein 6 [Anabrus simplex]|uniref:low-density lipoprotein receptor-related protein 6 n=1 Tax=Anabrus simplex TaxID=316456 RepID=UPI0035A2E618
MLVASWVTLISCLLTCMGLNEASHQATHLLYTTIKDIRMVTVSGTKARATPIVKDLDGCGAVDYYYKGGLVCWTDQALEMIQCVSYNGTTSGPKMTIVNTGLISPDGLACDWYTQKLYWTDGETNRVEVASLDGRHRQVLFWEDIDQPRAIVVVPMKGIMFWTDWGEVPKIERAGMNGDPSTRRAVVTEKIFWPNGLTVDYETETIYWLDGKLMFIASMDYDGGRRTTLVDSKVPYPFALTYFNNRLYWTDWSTWYIHMYDNTSRGKPRELLHSDETPLDILAWSPLRQPPGNTPCNHNNGGCSHLCLLAPYPPWYSCACPTGVKLINNLTCADGPQELLFVVQRTEISKVSLDSPDYTNFVLPLKDIKHAIAIDFDPVENYLYWTDDEVGALRRARLDGSGQEDLVVMEVAHPDGIAVDWIARNLYWTDTGMDRIEVARLTGSSRKVLINEDLLEPRAIALAPEQGWMFWSDWDNTRPKIERASLDGTDRRVLVNTSLGWPNGIALDLEEKRVYWCDAKTDKIEVINMNGTDRRVVISDTLPHLFGLSLLGNFLYWTDWTRRTIERVNKHTGSQRKVIADQLPNVMGLKVVRLGHVNGTNPCAQNNGGCSHLCLNKPDAYVCACQIGYELTADERTCVIPEAFLLYARKENIGRISIENSKNDAIIPITGVKDASALDFDNNDNRIYWTDVKLKTITRAFMNGSGVERIVEFGLDSPEGMAVDWVARNIYWTDTGSMRIEVARLDGSSRKVLLWTGVEQPRSIALDPREGYMYWSDWGSSGHIERAAMDGSRRSMLISKVGRAKGLTVDYARRRLYWTEAEPPAISTSDLDGLGRYQLVTQDIEWPYGLTQYQDYIYWTEWKTGNIDCVNKTTGLNRTRIHENLDGITDILVFHTSRQSGWNQCVTNGGCSHLCLALPSVGGSVANSHGASPNRQSSVYQCACPTHYILMPDNRTCTAPESFLIYSQRNSLSRLVPDTSDCPSAVLPIQGVKNARAVEFDPVSQYLYWIDGRTLAIKRVYDNGSHPSVLIPSGGSHHHPYDLAIDPYRRLLFWSCAVENVVNVSRLENGSEVGVIVRGPGEKPRSIALHPEKGLVFWTDVGKRSIFRAQLDGQNRVLIAREDVETLTGIAVDHTVERVYWARAKQISSANFEGKDRRVLVQDVTVTSLVVHGDHLYWADSEQQAIERVRKTDGRGREKVLTRISHLSDLVGVQVRGEQMMSLHNCSWQNEHGGCSHICLTVNNSAVCSCPRGLTLHDNGRTCSPPSACGPDHFTCLGSKDCVPNTWRCDGQTDCPDSSDEMDCPACRPDQFKCQGVKCIDKAWVCDGTSQCLDHSDELDCCARPGMFRCRNGRCIHLEAKCDGNDNCKDGSDEMNHDCPTRIEHTGPGPVLVETSKNPYMMGVLTTMAVIVVLALIGYSCRRRIIGMNNITLDDELEDSSGDPLSPKPLHGVPKPICQMTGIRNKNGHRSVGKGVAKPGAGADAVRLSMLNGSTTTSNSYDRSHITGASSSTTEGGVPHGAPLLVSSSSLLCYPRETLNPPPSPATTADSNRRMHHNYNEDYWCSSSGASKYRPYRHYRAINQPPPPTPCSTDVCDESDSNYPLPHHGRARYYAPPGSEYDSDPFPPPPTPRSHYHSDGGMFPSSCPPSPSSTVGRSSTYFNPLPPPPSPVPSPSSRCDC